MNIIDHLSIGVPSIATATKFYDGLLGALDCSLLASNEAFAAYGNGSVQFLLMVPENGEVFSVGNGTHICFIAPSKEAVDALHNFAIDNGGECAGAPGPRPSYPTPDVYTTFIRDPFGNKIEAIYNGFNQYNENTGD